MKQLSMSALRYSLGLAFLVAIFQGCAIEKRTLVSLQATRAPCPAEQACLEVTVYDGSHEMFFGAKMHLTDQCSHSIVQPVPIPNDGFIHLEALESRAQFNIPHPCRRYLLSIEVSAARYPSQPWTRAERRRYEVPITIERGHVTVAEVRLGCYRYVAAFD
jgi:hypothetical protein